MTHVCIVCRVTQWNSDRTSPLLEQFESNMTASKLSKHCATAQRFVRVMGLGHLRDLLTYSDLHRSHGHLHIAPNIIKSHTCPFAARYADSPLDHSTARGQACFKEARSQRFCKRAKEGLPQNVTIVTFLPILHVLIRIDMYSQNQKHEQPDLTAVTQNLSDEYFFLTVRSSGGNRLRHISATRLNSKPKVRTEYSDSEYVSSIGEGLQASKTTTCKLLYCYLSGLSRNHTDGRMRTGNEAED